MDLGFPLPPIETLRECVRLLTGGGEAREFEAERKYYAVFGSYQARSRVNAHSALAQLVTLLASYSALHAEANDD